MKNNYVDWFFLLIGAFFILLGSGDVRGMQVFFIALGGALIGSALAFRGVRKNSKDRRK